MFQRILTKLMEKQDLTMDESRLFMTALMEGQVTQAQIGSFLTALRMKGETVEEITGCAMVLRDKAERISPRVPFCVDTCGTGGDAAGTFNISTAAALVTAAGGVPVAKHGNRAVSSSSGSADVLEALGVQIELHPKTVEECIERTGIGFMFAPFFHRAMRYATGPRKELGVRTVFNIIGPITNPAGAKGQVLGVYHASLTEPIAGVLRNLGVERALVVHGMDGLDELTLTTSTRVSELKEGVIRTYMLEPEQYGLQRSESKSLKGGDAKVNAEIIRSVLLGMPGPMRDIVLLNSGAALYVGKAVSSIYEGIQRARRVIDEGLAMEKLRELIRTTKSSRIEGEDHVPAENH